MKSICKMQQESLYMYEKKYGLCKIKQENKKGIIFEYFQLLGQKP